MSRARGTHRLENPLLPRNAKLHQDFLENFFWEAMASLICPDKTEAKWHNYGASRSSRPEAFSCMQHRRKHCYSDTRSEFPP